MTKVAERLEDRETQTGSIPVRATTGSQGTVENPQVVEGEAWHKNATTHENRPQTVPTSRRLTRQHLRDLIGLLAAEVGHCGLDTQAGQRAQELQRKLQAIHNHGWPANEKGQP